MFWKSSCAVSAVRCACSGRFRHNCPPMSTRFTVSEIATLMIAGHEAMEKLGLAKRSKP